MTKVKKSKKAKESVSHNHRSEKLPVPFDVVYYVDELERFVALAMPLLAKSNVFSDQNKEKDNYVSDLIGCAQMIQSVKSTLSMDGYQFNPSSDEHCLNAPWLCDSSKSEVKKRLAE